MHIAPEHSLKVGELVFVHCALLANAPAVSDRRAVEQTLPKLLVNLVVNATHPLGKRRTISRIWWLIAQNAAEGLCARRARVDVRKVKHEAAHTGAFSGRWGG